MELSDSDKLKYIYIHRGDGMFDCITPYGDILEVGDNTKGMIRYVFFEDFTLPEMGWSVTHKELMEAYFPKVIADIKSGKIKRDEDGNFREGYE